MFLQYCVLSCLVKLLQSPALSFLVALATSESQFQALNPLKVTKTALRCPVNLQSLRYQLCTNQTYFARQNQDFCAVNSMSIMTRCSANSKFLPVSPAPITTALLGTLIFLCHQLYSNQNCVAWQTQNVFAVSSMQMTTGFAKRTAFFCTVISMTGDKKAYVTC